MRVAFYAPLKPPDHPVPSGDRRMAALLTEALGRAGCEVELACHLRSRDPLGDPARQARLETLGAALGRRLVARYRRRPAPERPDLWFTYHLYYKAPDWLGPGVSRALGIPYIVAEASVANKRAGGPWDAGHRATLAALDQAERVIALNSQDALALPDRSRVEPLKPFLDPAPYGRAAARRPQHRATLAGRLGLDPAKTWLVALAMMRPGDKLASYRMLADALGRIDREDWVLIAAGDGPARPAVEAAFAGFPPGRVHFAGETSQAETPDLLSAGDLFVWPAVNEAYGMALLEAQASGLPVVAGRTGGVPDIVDNGVTGLLSAPGDTAAFAAALTELLSDEAARAAMGRAARRHVAAEHGLDAAARRLGAILSEAVGRP
ncbi:MAG: glycosyltransferase family 4 protein [Kiloniellales bacterium]|nr:glycosyltransferase family 4 protein [Kiloniellales bacterium]